MKIGHIVCKTNGSLRSGGCGYRDAVVLSVIPFILVSRGGDMRWTQEQGVYFASTDEASLAHFKNAHHRLEADDAPEVIQAATEHLNKLIELEASRPKTDTENNPETFIALVNPIVPLLLTFDTEAVGFHGEGFSFGYNVTDQNGRELEHGMFAAPRHKAAGNPTDRAWIEQNVPETTEVFNTLLDLRDEFWKIWTKWRAQGATMMADCAWPVEARFLIQCVTDNRDERNWEGPYPLLDLSTFLRTKGVDPTQSFARQAREEPAHNPLADARQSARIWRNLEKGILPDKPQ